ncbi:hypothetical protein Vafri_11435 [Volvox africanus]|nr:hypothetical protein Vafri_11435 [Volvox africanus]
MGHSTDALLRAFANFPDARCQTPLHLACIYGHHEVAERLLQLGGTPWAWDELGGRTPLHYAASMGHVDVIRVIVSHNAPAPTGDALRRPNSSRTRLVDICNDSGYTPLHYAVWAVNPTSVRALTSYEASLSARNVACGSDWVVSCLKCTPLHLAAYKGNQTIVKLLLSAYVQYQPPQGTDAPTLNDRRRRDPRRHVNANRQLPYHVAVARNHAHLTEMLHPDVPFSFVLNPAEMESRLYGVPKLAVLAAKTLQYKLVADIESAVAAMAAATTRSTVPSLCSAGTLGGAARMRSGSLVALSGAVMAAATGQAVGNAATATAQQVLAAATARLRSVNERSLHGSTGALQAMDSAGLPALVASTPSQQQRPAVGADSVAPADVLLQPPAAVVVAAPSVTTSGGVAVTATTSASATAVANGAAGKQPSSPSSGKSLATSAGASDGEALPLGPASDLAARPTVVDEGGGAATPLAVLPLPPAPISPFLHAASSAAASSGAAGDTPQSGRRPTFNEAASAFALFAAEPFDEPTGGGGGAGGAQALQPAGSASVSLAVLARNRAMLAASSSSLQTAGSNSIGIAVLARSKLAPGGGAGAGNKVTPSHSRSLRALLTGNKNRRPNASNAGGAVPSSMAGPQQQQTQPHARSELSSAEDLAAVAGDVLDDLDDILEAMRPPDDITTGEVTPPTAAVAAISSTTADAAGSVLDTAAAATPPSASQLSSLQARARGASGGGSRPFWRRLSTHAIASSAASESTQQLTPEAGPSCNGSLHAGHGGTVGTAPPETLLSSASMRSRAPSLPLPPPPGVIESRGSTEVSGIDVAVATSRRQPPLTPMESINDDSDAAALQLNTGVRSLRRSSISLASLARGGAEAVLQTLAEPEQVDGAVLAMLASLVEAPQNVLRRYRLLQLTHGLDLQDLLRDHSEQAAAAAAGTLGALGHAHPSTILDGQSLQHTASDARVAAAVTTLLPSSTLHVTTAARCPAGDGKVEDSMHVGTAIAACAIAATNCSVASVSGGRASVDAAYSASFRQVLPPGGSASPFSQEASNSTVISTGARPPTCTDLNVEGLAAAGAGCLPTNAASANLAGQLLRTLSSAAASESGEGTCGVCFDQPDVLSILRCGHRLCADCSRELCKLNALKPALCPFCRGMIGGFKYIGRS